MDLLTFLPDIEQTFRALAGPIRKAFDAPPEVAERKLDGTLVTALDKSLERYLAATLLSLEPTWGFVGEEGGRLRVGTPTWHVDPLDGTLNFTRRLPLFASQGALVDEAGEPLIGVIFDALRGEFSWAAHGAGAWREKRRLAVGSRPLSDAVVLVDVPRRGGFVDHPEWMGRLRSRVYRVRALGSISVSLLLVATGAVDAFVVSRRGESSLHDLGPGVLMVREAGGLVTDLEGNDPLHQKCSILAASPSVHAELLETFA